MKQHLKALLVEDNYRDTDLIREMLLEPNGATVELERVARLTHGLDRLDKGSFDLVLLDLSLPDSHGFETFITTRNYVPQMPIIVLTGLNDENLAIKAVREGAQDYLIKGEVNGHLLRRSIRYAVERKRVEEERREQTRRIQRQQRAIVELVSHEAIVSGDVIRAARVITETSAQTLGVERVGVWLLSGEETRLRCVDLFERTAGRHSSGSSLYVDDCPRYFACLQEARVIDADDALADPRTRELADSTLRPLGIHSRLDAAIRVSGEVVGVICHEPVGESRQWHADEITFAGELADQVAQVLLNAERRQTSEALRQRTIQLEALREVTLAITSELDLDNLLRDIVLRAIDLVGGTAGGLSLHRPEENILDFAIHTGLESVPEDARLRYGEGVAGRIWETGEAINIGDYASWERSSDRWRGCLGNKADIGVPITWGGKFLGVLEVMKASPGCFSSEDAEVLSLFAAQAAIAIENARLFESQRQRAEEIQGLANVVRRINSTLDLKHVLEVIAMQAAELSCSDAGAVFELEDEGDVLGLTAAYDISPALVKVVNASGVRLGEGAVGRAAADREPYQMADLSSVPDFPFRERLVAEGFQSILAVPMLRGETLLGGIVLVRKEPRAFSSHVVDLVGTLAEHGAIAVDNARLHQQVKDHAEQLEGLVRERTAELEAQHAEIEAIMENVTEGIVVTDMEGDIIHANPVAEALLRRRLPSREARELSTVIQDLARQADEQPKRMVELESLDLELQAAPIAEPGLKRAAAVVAVHDVTHLKELDRMKSRFVSNVSHELRTPIATIKLLGDLMRQQPERWREHLDLLIQEADQQAELVEHILDISRIDCDRLEMRLRPTSVTKLVKQLVKARQATASEKQLTLKHCPSNGQLLTTADPHRMKQVLNNLLSNAIRYTRAGGEITVSTGFEEAEGRPWVTVTVADTGIGIPRDELPHLFERFYRGQLPRRMEIPGTGLGLSIVREIVRLHGGRVTVESEVGEGSAFTVWLPPYEGDAPS